MLSPDNSNAKGRKSNTKNAISENNNIQPSENTAHKKRQSPKTIPIHHLRHLRHRESLRQNDAEAVHQEQKQAEDTDTTETNNQTETPTIQASGNQEPTEAKAGNSPNRDRDTQKMKPPPMQHLQP